jgi:hypothetical protein
MAEDATEASGHAGANRRGTKRVIKERKADAEEADKRVHFPSPLRRPNLAPVPKTFVDSFSDVVDQHSSFARPADPDGMPSFSRIIVFERSLLLIVLRSATMRRSSGPSRGCDLC